jgi:hypothetical protein
LQKRKKPRRTLSRDLINDEALRTSMVKNLDILYHGLQSVQRTTKAILGLIYTQYRTLIFESLIERILETLPVTQTRSLFEQGVRDIEEPVRTLVADLVEDMWAQQRCVISLKQGTHYYGAVKERDVNHDSSTHSYTAPVESATETGSPSVRYGARNAKEVNSAFEDTPEYIVTSATRTSIGEGTVY